jgi:AraC family transcriptional regulator, activator of mtrCDE
MMPVRGRLDLRCSYGAPWRIDSSARLFNEIRIEALGLGNF